MTESKPAVPRAIDCAVGAKAGDVQLGFQLEDGGQLVVSLSRTIANKLVTLLAAAEMRRQ